MTRPTLSAAALAAADEAGLGVTARLLSSCTRAGRDDPATDPLADPAASAPWLAQLAAASPDLAGASVGLGGGMLSARDLAALRRFREALRDARTAGRATAPEPAEFRSTVDLTWTPDGVRAAPHGHGAARVRAAVTLELLRAEASGLLPRFKTCAHTPCGYPFLDASRNRSRTWHDTARCGNLVNLRASRTRPH